MFCPNCGNQMPDGSKFCTGCGNALTASQPAQPTISEPVYSQPQAPVYTQPDMNAAPLAPAKKSKTPLIIALSVIAVLLIAAAIIVFVVIKPFDKDKDDKKSGKDSGSDYKAAVEKYMKAWEKQDYEALVDAMVSDDLMDALEDARGISRKDLINHYKNNFDGIEITKVKYKITDTEKVDKDDFGDFIEDIGLDPDDVKIDGLYKIAIEGEVVYEYDGEEDSDDLDTTGAYVYKSGKKWYYFGKP